MIISIIKLLIDQHEILQTIEDEFQRTLDLILSPTWAVKISTDRYELMSKAAIDN